MTPPPDAVLAARIYYAAELLEAIADGIKANTAHLPATPAKSELSATLPELRKISCVYSRQASSIQSIPHIRQQTAAIGRKKRPRGEEKRA